MPKEEIQISAFAGMVGVLDQRDVPPGLAVYAENLDLAVEAGAFVPLPADSTAKTGVTGTIFTPFDDGTKAAYYDTTAGNLKYLSGLGGTITVNDLGAVTRSGRDTGASDGEAVRVGLGSSSSSKPYWVGTIRHQQFDTDPGVVIGTVSHHEAELVSTAIEWNSGDGDTRTLPSTSGGNSVNEEVFFFRKRAYFYYCTCVYDGLQESPLRYFKTITVSDTSADFSGQQDADGYKSVAFKIRAYTSGPPAGLTTINRRVTGVNIYRSEGNISVAAGTPIAEGLPYFVEHIDINDDGWVANDSGGAFWEELTFTDRGQTHATFESRTGLPPTLTHMQLHYGLSSAVDGYHIVGDIWHTDLKDVETYLFRSKSYRFDTFDWSIDYLQLPSEPNALVAFLGKVYAFCDGRTYVINASTFSIEDTWEGIGAADRRAVVASDRGMFFADGNNIYHHDGSRLTPIGRAVLKNRYLTEAGWLDGYSSSHQILAAYDARYDALVLIYRSSTPTTYGYLYHVATGRWTHLTFAANDATNAVVPSPDGRVLFSLGTTLYELFGSGTKRTWTWVSQDFVRGMGALRKFYHLYLTYSAGQPTPAYFHNTPNADSASVPSAVAGTASAGTDMIRTRVNSQATAPYDSSRSFMLKVTGTAAQDAKEMTLIFREITPR